MNLFEQMIDVLVVGAIGLTMVKTYLIANKVWSRKHNKDVSESVSVSAQLIGIMTSLPFMIKYSLIDGGPCGLEGGADFAAAGAQDQRENW